VAVFSIDDDVINIASDLYAQLRKKGVTIGDADIFIAAIVIKNKGILVTNNIKHYENIEQLNLINWL
jgi:predicted nucleic acid-binding protein